MGNRENGLKGISKAGIFAIFLACLRSRHEGSLAHMPFPDAASLATHFRDHAPLLGIATVAEYEARAEAFLAQVLCDTCRECDRKQGGKARFNEATSEYATFSSWGYIATYMILETAKHRYPTNLEYYLARCN